MSNKPIKTKKTAETAIAKVIRLAGGQPQLAQQLGVTQQNVSKWYLSGHTPLKRALQIAEMFDVPARMLVSPTIRDIFMPKKRA